MFDFLRFFTKISLLIVIIAGGILLLLPSLLSTNWGKEKLIQWVNSSIDGSLEMENIRLTWRGKQIFQQVVLRDLENKPVIIIEEVSTETSLWQLYKKNLQGITEIKNLDASITTDEKGKTNLEQIFKLLPAAQNFLQPLSQLNFAKVAAKANFTPVHPFSFSLSGNSQQEGIEGSFAIDCTLNGLHISQWQELKERLPQYLMTPQSDTATIRAHMIHFPTFLIKYFLTKKDFSKDLLSLIGDEIDFFVTKGSQAKDFTFGFSTLSPLVKSQIEGSLTTKKISFQLLASAVEFPTLPVQLQANIESKNFWKTAQTKILVSHSSQPIANLTGIISNLDSIQHSSANWREIGFDLNLHMKDLNLSLELPFFHSAWLKNIQIFFGDATEVNMSSTMQNLTGPLSLIVEGSNGNLLLDGFCKEGVLYLLKPLTTKCRLHPLLSQLVFSQHMPLLQSAEKSEAPIQITIQPEQFSCSLAPFQIEKVTVGQGTLDLGKIYFSPTSELASILTLFSSQAKDTLLIWFTPIYFGLSKGEMSIERVDLLINGSYGLASWGRLNLLDSQGDFIIGLPSTSLNHLFGIKGLDPAYILQVPIWMRKGKIEIDRNKFSNAIAALLAQTKSGEVGGWLNKLLDQVPAAPLSNPPSPPPTTQPFPWADSITPQSQEESSSSEEKTKKKPKIKNLLKKFLGQ